MIDWGALTTDQVLIVLAVAPHPLAVICGDKSAQLEVEKLIGDDPTRWESRSAEFRGDRGGHSFHGNQHTGGKGGGPEPPTSTMGSGNVVPSGPKGRKELVQSLRDHGYTGPVSYSVGKLQMIHDEHVGKAKVATDHPAASTKAPATTTVKIHDETSAADSAKYGKLMRDGAERNLAHVDHPGVAVLKRYQLALDDENASTEVNHSMRTGKPNADAKALTDLMSSHPQYIGRRITVDRGVTGAHAAQITKAAGTSIEYKSFISTTYEQAGTAKSQVVGFGGGDKGATIMRITVSPGTKYLPGTKHEGEMILPPGKMRVSHVSKTTVASSDVFGRETRVPATIVHMEYLG